MKEIDFLPDWYKDGRRRRCQVRRQYVALAIIFMAMVSYNVTSTHRITRASAEVARCEEQRIQAESVLHQFTGVTKQLNEVRVKADLIERIDSRIDMAAVLAEMSHIIGETTILKRIEFVAEPFGEDKSRKSSTAGVRAADSAGPSADGVPLGDARFRIQLTGLAVSPADVAALVRRLDDSSYFRGVSTSWRNGTVQVPVRAPATQPKGAATRPAEALDVSEFEIVCYLANYKEVDTR
jgi:hypothetical protein